MRRQRRRHWGIFTCLFVLMSCSSPAAGQPKFSVFGFEHHAVNKRATLTRHQLRLSYTPGAVIGLQNFNRWIHGDSTDILLGVTSQELADLTRRLKSKQSPLNKLTKLRLGAMYPLDGKNLLMLAPEHYRVLVPMSYALWNTNVVPRDKKRKLWPEEDAAEILGLFSAFPYEHPLGPKKSVVVRYPADLEDDDGDENGENGCNSTRSIFMICDPDAMRVKLPRLMSSPDTIRPEFKLFVDKSGYEMGSLGALDQPTCDRTIWQRISNRTHALQALPKIVGTPQKHQKPGVRSKVLAIYSMIDEFPFDAWTIYAMICDNH